MLRVGGFGVLRIQLLQKRASRKQLECVPNGTVLQVSEDEVDAVEYWRQGNASLNTPHMLQRRNRECHSKHHTHRPCVGMAAAKSLSGGPRSDCASAELEVCRLEP